MELRKEICSCWVRAKQTKQRLELGPEKQGVDHLGELTGWESLALHSSKGQKGADRSIQMGVSTPQARCLWEKLQQIWNANPCCYPKTLLPPEFLVSLKPQYKEVLNNIKDKSESGNSMRWPRLQHILMETEVI